MIMQNNINNFKEHLDSIDESEDSYIPGIVDAPIIRQLPSLLSVQDLHSAFSGNYQDDEHDELFADNIETFVTDGNLIVDDSLSLQKNQVLSESLIANFNPETSSQGFNDDPEYYDIYYSLSVIPKN